MSSPDSPHHQSPLLPHSHVLHSLPVQHQTPLSDISCASPSSLPAGPLSYSPGVSTTRQKTSLRRDDVLQFMGGSRRGSGGCYYSSGGRPHKSSLQSEGLVSELGSGGGQSEAAGNIVKESSGREDMMTKLQASSAEPGREGSEGISKPVDSRCAGSIACSSTPLGMQHDCMMKSHALSKCTVQQPHTIPGSRHLSSIGPQLSLPMLSTASSYHKRGTSKAKWQEPAMAGAVLEQEGRSRTPRGDGNNTRQKMKRQDSGIETLASSFSVSP